MQKENELFRLCSNLQISFKGFDERKEEDVERGQMSK